MGYDVTTSAFIGIRFEIEISDHPDVDWTGKYVPEEKDEVDEMDDFEEMDNDEVQVNNAVKRAIALGLDVGSDVDGEQSSTDSFYIGLDITGMNISQVNNAIKCIEQIMTLELIQEFVDIMEREPVLVENDNGTNSRKITMHAPFNKCW